jgi:hypothetical protein
MRDAVWREYRPGQETDKKPSARYMAVQRRAVGEAAFKPHDEEAVQVAAWYLVDAHRRQAIAMELGEGDPFALLDPSSVQGGA